MAEKYAEPKCALKKSATVGLGIGDVIDSQFVSCTETTLMNITPTITTTHKQTQNPHFYMLHFFLFSFVYLIGSLTFIRHTHCGCHEIEESAHPASVDLTLLRTHTMPRQCMSKGHSIGTGGVMGGRLNYFNCCVKTSHCTIFRVRTVLQLHC